MPLRDYQREAVQAIVSKRKEGVTRQLVVLPTAAGKTICFGSLPEAIPLPKGKQMWALAHRDELITQAQQKIQRLNPDLKVGIEQEKLFHDPSCDIVVGSVPTLALLGNRVNRIRVNDVDTVIVDEAHHSSADSYKRVLALFRVLKGEPNEDVSRLLTGVTATPDRTDNIGLEAIYDEIVYSKDIREMIEAGWLASILAWQVATSVDLSGVGVRHGDFITKQLENAVNTEQRNQLVVDKYIELGDNGPAIAFTVDVRHSHDLALQFRRAGINALPISGSTPDAERKRLLAAHEAEDVKVLTSCSVLSEGADLPWASVGLLARPTKSGLLFRQMIGRLLRLYPAPEEGEPRKRKAKIIDFVDNTARHILCNIPSLFGLPQKLKLSGEDVLDAVEEVEAAQEKVKRELPVFSTLGELRASLAMIDLLSPPRVPAEIEGMSKFLWVRMGKAYELVLPEYILSVAEDGLGRFHITRRAKGVANRYPLSLSLPGALEAAESMVPAQERMLVSRAVRWRSMPPSDKQIKALRMLNKMLAQKFPDFAKFREFVLGNYTRGDVSTMIDQIKLKKGKR